MRDLLISSSSRSRGIGEQEQQNTASKAWLCEWGWLENHTGRGNGKRMDRITVKWQQITPSSSVNPGTLRVGMADATSSGPASSSPPHPQLPPCLSRCISSLPPGHFQISSLHPPPPQSLLTSFWASSLIHLFPVSQHTAAKLIS